MSPAPWPRQGAFVTVRESEPARLQIVSSPRRRLHERRRWRSCRASALTFSRGCTRQMGELGRYSTVPSSSTGQAPVLEVGRPSRMVPTPCQDIDQATFRGPLQFGSDSAQSGHRQRRGVCLPARSHPSPRDQVCHATNQKGKRTTISHPVDKRDLRDLTRPARHLRWLRVLWGLAELEKLGVDNGAPRFSASDP
jgi:hypothetical protein